MPVLASARYERFAQELAKGKTADEAYVLAGYKENRGNASVLKSNQSILNRVVEIQAGAAQRAEVTVISIATELEEARRLAIDLGQPAAAVSASMGKAKIYGLVVEKREVGQPGEFDRMSDHELDDFIRAEAQALGLSNGGAEKANRQKGVRGKSSRLHS